MNNQEVFNMLSELESFFYYRMQNPEGLPFKILVELHEELNTAAKQWHNLTGCENE